MKKMLAFQQVSGVAEASVWETEKMELEEKGELHRTKNSHFLAGGWRVRKEQPQRQ